MADFDIQIKGGTIVDGTRVPRYRGDVWIKDGKIAQIGGRAPGFAKKAIDADGLIVAPGFVDLHTHYDAQIRWDPYCTISGWHGVTSLVLGNCGFGFAPFKPEFRDRSMLTMTRTEAIPYASMKAGMNWDWETIPQYLDSLDRAPKGINCIQYMPTASLMIYVMGLEAAKTRPATEAERAEMARLLDEGMDAGLCGFSIQRLGKHSAQADFDGSPMVTDTMCDEDILNLARVLRRARRRLHRNHAGHRPHQRRPGIRREAGRRSRSARFCSRRSRRPPRIPRSIASSLNWLQKRSARRVCRFSARRAPSAAASPSPSRIGTCTNRCPAWRDMTTGTKEEKTREDEGSRPCARRSRATSRWPSSTRSLRGIGGTPGKLIVQWVENKPRLEKYVGKIARPDRHGRRQASGRSDARSRRSRPI